MNDTPLILSIMQIYSEIFPEWGLSIFPPIQGFANYTEYNKYKNSNNITVQIEVISFTGLK